MRDKCYLIPNGKRQAIRVHCGKKPSKRTQNALRTLFNAAYAALAKQQLEKKVVQ